MEDTIKKFLEYLREIKNYSGNTVRGYSEDLKGFSRFINPNNGLYKEIFLPDINKNHVLSFLKSSQSVKKISASYRNRRLYVLRSFFKYCLKEGLLKIDPSQGIERAKVNIQERDFFTYEDYERTIDYIEKSTISDFYKLRNLAIVSVLYNTGLRLHELINLDIENIDFAQQEFRNFRRKGGNTVNLVINSEVVKRLQNWIIFRKKAGIEVKALFISDRMQRINQRTIQILISRYVKESGLKKKITPHSYRHAFCTEIQNRGASMKTAKELMNHSNITTTARYSHTDRDAMKRAVESLTKSKKEK